MSDAPKNGTKAYVVTENAPVRMGSPGTCCDLTDEAAAHPLRKGHIVPEPTPKSGKSKTKADAERS